MFGVVFLAPYARTTRYEESVLPKGKKRPRSLRSLGLGMYPLFIGDADGEEIENPISIVKEQSGETLHFLDMEIVQSKPGVSQIRMYDKRDHMATLAEYRRYPHVETRLSPSCIYATLHCQLCRFETRCTEMLYFRITAAKPIKDMIKNRCVKEKLRNTLPNFKNAFFEKSPITENIKDVNKPRVRDLYWWGSHQQLIYLTIFGGEIVRMGG